MKVLLVNPRLWTNYNPFPFPPLGLISISAPIKDRHRIYIEDRNLRADHGDKRLTTLLKEFQPDIVGLTSLTGPGLLDALHVSKIARAVGSMVVWGGTHASLFPEQTLQSPHIDYLVIGEGEETFSELLDTLQDRAQPDTILSLGFKRDGEVILNEKRPFIEKLDRLPMPAWELIDVKKYLYTFKGCRRKLEIVSSRGCPFSCSFCYNLKFNKRHWRGKSAGKIIEEIEFLRQKYKVDGFRFADDNFVVNKKRLGEFCSEISRRRIPIKWDANARVDDVSDDFLRIVQEGNCNRLTFGIESGSPRMLEFLKKDITIQMIEEAFELLSRTKIMTTAAFMIGLPTETLQEMRMTVDFAKKIKAHHTHLYLYCPYPGSDLTEFCVKGGLHSYPDSLEGWAHFSYSGVNPDMDEAEITRLSAYFQLRNFINSVRRGEWAILANFLQPSTLANLPKIIEFLAPLIPTPIRYIKKRSKDKFLSNRTYN